MKTGNGIVDVVATMGIKGNMIHNTWFSNIRLDNGKSDLNAIVLLSEIYYWYTPTEERNDQGFTIGYRKKFKSDLLQKSYEQLGAKFGLTKRQVKDALDRLEARGVIKKHFRNLKTESGPINNVLYIELVPSVLYELNSMDLQTNEFDVTFKSNTTQREDDSQLTFDSETNTEITTKTTTKTTTSKNPSSELRYGPEDDCYKLAELLYKMAKRNNEKFKEPNMQKWSNDFRLMLEVDEYTPLEIQNLIVFSQNDDFWKGNILSPAKLRKQGIMLTNRRNEMLKRNGRYQQKQQALPIEDKNEYDDLSL